MTPVRAESTANPARRLRPQSTGLADVEIVLVSYFSRPQVEALLDAVDRDQRVVIVDNASGADGLVELAAARPRVRYLDGGDVGFAAAANLGAATSTATYVIFANPDSRPSMETWAALIDELAADPTLGSCAAATVDASGCIEIGVGGWEPTVRRCLVTATGLNQVLRNAGVYARPAVAESVALDWLTGACLAVRRSTFDEVGRFDERYFVYNEDMAFGRQLRSAGYGQRLRTDLTVRHEAGSSGGGSTAMPQQRGASMAAYLRDHNGPGRARLMGSILAFGMLPRIAVAIGRWRPDLARKHLAYIRGITTGRSPYRP